MALQFAQRDMKKLRRRKKATLVLRTHFSRSVKIDLHKYLIMLLMYASFFLFFFFFNSLPNSFF